ncbi:mannose-1-phosphate guanylyltransferase/mannose-6-phosphate isomerase [Sphingomonas morindae]|uniref:Mannose-1-phosphate guanylyltransferase/mannose-6-phosphate isomerase n=1 Tax=Sphingomonas morindae TaxID=1541170 RepID=A0ABY4X917_9SPHN|nr:mannose-1-phosphate guanylyltransferase/mannose-6-phosphate isomerase [Sphingomonas morindae]USI73176.1 mannose-1-phosphate guanylyltransferase/mannose-6-phosphate isomerase [Sphingomonas morindae]
MITPVILSGGSGTRLWPLSRSGRPKQLLPLTADQTMLQLTVARATGDGFGAPIIVANAAHAEEIEQQLAAADQPDGLIILEPSARNTAPAIALAAFAAAPDATLLVMPSDHVISDVAAFHAAIRRARPLVDQGWMITFGIAAHAPETGYGYICRGDELAPGVHRVERFVEKPDLATAQSYLDQGCYSWNGGIFLFTAGAFIEALETQAPAMAIAAREAVAQARRDNQRLHPDPVAFGRSPADSIDYAVMEKADRVAVVPVEMGWSDVGSWDALHELARKDNAGNASHGDVIALDTRNCLIRSEGPVVAAVGVQNLIIVATEDAVLILPRGDSQQVKRAIAELQKDGHVTLHRPL